VGVIDMDTIGRQTGYARRIEEELANLQRQVAAVKQQKEQELEAMRKKFGEKPTDEQNKEFQKAAVESEQILRRVAAQADQKFQEQRGYWISQLNLVTKGPLDKVTKKRGITVVLNKTNAIYWSADAVDITDEVFELISTAAAAGMPTAPALQPSAPKSGSATDSGSAPKR
jgi:Skp family chaperone for outer membrane proteins